MASRRKQRGFFEFLAPVASALVGGLFGEKGQEDTNETNQQINTAQMAFNAEEAQKAREFNSGQAQDQRYFNSWEAATNREFNRSEASVSRDWQEEMRSTQYQAAIGDMKAAGINPMLAFRNGGAGTPSGATASGSAATSGMASGPSASAGSMIPMQNKNQAAMNAAMSAAQIANVQSQTKVNDTQAQKIEAEIPQTVASTGQIRQSTENLKAELYNIKEKMGEIIANKELLIKQGYNATEQGNLLRAQRELTEINKLVQTEQIGYTQAQTKLNNVLTTLKGLETAGAKNTADWENTMGSGSGNVATVIKTLKGILGK